MSQQEWDQKELEALKELVGIALQVTTVKMPEILDAGEINLNNAQKAKESLINFVQENGLVVKMSSHLMENQINKDLEKQVSKVRMDVQEYILGADDNNSVTSPSHEKQKKGRERNA